MLFGRPLVYITEKVLVLVLILVLKKVLITSLYGTYERSRGQFLLVNPSLFSVMFILKCFVCFFHGASVYFSSRCFRVACFFSCSMSVYRCKRLTGKTRLRNDPCNELMAKRYFVAHSFSVEVQQTASSLRRRNKISLSTCSWRMLHSIPSAPTAFQLRIQGLCRASFRPT